MGHHDQARMHAEQALSIYRGLGNRSGEARALESLGWHLAMLGSCTPAVTCCQRALDLHRELGNRLGEAHALDHLGYASHRLGDDAAACGAQRVLNFHRPW
jgi:tetratricopeptide (TPR) repeat protein